MMTYRVRKEGDTLPAAREGRTGRPGTGGVPDIPGLEGVEADTSPASLLNGQAVSHGGERGGREERLVSQRDGPAAQREPAEPVAPQPPAPSVQEAEPAAVNPHRSLGAGAVDDDFAAEEAAPPVAGQPAETAEDLSGHPLVEKIGGLRNKWAQELGPSAIEPDQLWKPPVQMNSFAEDILGLAGVRELPLLVYCPKELRNSQGAALEASGETAESLQLRFLKPETRFVVGVPIPESEAGTGPVISGRDFRQLANEQTIVAAARYVLGPNHQGESGAVGALLAIVGAPTEDRMQVILEPIRVESDVWLNQFDEAGNFTGPRRAETKTAPVPEAESEAVLEPETQEPRGAIGDMAARAVSSDPVISAMNGQYAGRKEKAPAGGTAEIGEVEPRIDQLNRQLLAQLLQGTKPADALRLMHGRLRLEQRLEVDEQGNLSGVWAKTGMPVTVHFDEVTRLIPLESHAWLDQDKPKEEMVPVGATLTFPNVDAAQVLTGDLSARGDDELLVRVYEREGRVEIRPMVRVKVGENWRQIQSGKLPISRPENLARLIFEISSGGVPAERLPAVGVDSALPKTWAEKPGKVVQEAPQEERPEHWLNWQPRDTEEGPTARDLAEQAGLVPAPGEPISYGGEKRRQKRGGSGKHHPRMVRIQSRKKQGR